MKNYRAELTGVFGDPVDDNPTGVVEEAAFAAKDLNYRYLTVKVLPEDLGKAMDSVRIFGMKGINLTMPHKIKVLPYLEKKFAFDLRLAAANLAEVKLLQIRNIMIEDLKPRLKLIKK